MKIATLDIESILWANQYVDFSICLIGIVRDYDISKTFLI